MPTIEYNIEQEQLELINGGVTSGEEFSEGLGHYVKLSVYDNNGNFIKSYFSNRDWNNELIMFNQANQPLNHSDPTTIDGAPTPQVVIYRPLDDSGDKTWWIKPNDVLSNDPSTDYSTGQFKLKFDFLKNIFYSNQPSDKRDVRRWYVNEISDSRKEIRLLARVNQWQQSTHLGYCESEEFTNETDCPEGEWIPNPNYGEITLIDDNAIAPLTIDFRQWFDSTLKGGIEQNPYEFNFFLTLPNSSHMMIVNWEWDFSSLDSTSLILKLKDPLPTTIDLLYKNVSIEREIYDTQLEKILFIGDDVEYEEVTTLTPTSDNLNTDSTYNNTLQSYNQLIDSSSMSNEQQSMILESIFSSSADSLDVDFSKFENHVHFGSAELKFKNFYDKVKRIETEYTNISSSLNVLASSIRTFSTSSGDVLNRKKSYETINGIISNFTPYEKWMYYNYSTTASMPNMGLDYSTIPAISGTLSENSTYIDGGKSEILNDYYGLKSVYKISTIGENVVRSGSLGPLSLGNTPLSASWYTGSTYTTDDEGWYISGSGIETALYVHQTASFGQDLPYVYQVSTQSFASDGTIQDPPINSNIQQFESGQSYVIEFDVNNFEDTGSVVFRFHAPNHGYNDGIYQTSVLVNSTGSFKGISNEISVGNSSNDPGNSYNYLTILSDGGFSGSIDNLNIRAQKDNDGRGDIFTDIYRVEKPPFANTTSSFYLSFLGQFSDEPTLENYNASQSVDLGSGRNIPMDAYQGGYYSTSETFSPAYESGSFKHYIIEASQSHWRFSDVYGTDIGEGLSSTALAVDSTKYEILSESRITGSENFQMIDNNGLFDGTGDPSYWNLMAYQSQSILPSGELFRYYHTTSSEALAPVTSSILTDVKIMRKDNMWNGNPEDVLLFSHTYSTSSSVVQEWYDVQLANAKSYDLQNIYSIRNNLPKHLFRNESEAIVLNKFLSVVGESYDFLKLYIDNYERITNRNYNKYSGTPDSMIDLVGEHFGWEFLNINNIKPLLDYYIGPERSFSYKDLTYSIWRNIINNLVSIYKTKGTETSIRSLMNCFGIPPNALTINQYGNSTIKAVSTSPGEFDLSVPEPIDEREGNVSYNILDRNLTLLNFRTDGNLGFITNWNIVTGSSKVNTGLNTAFSFVMNPTQTGSNQTLAFSSGSHSQSLWRLQMSESTHQPEYSASLHFQINTSPSSSNWSTLMSSSNFGFKENPNQLTHVLVSRDNMNSGTGSYKMSITSRKSGMLYNEYYTTSSKVIDSSTSYGNIVNTNFTSSGWMVGGISPGGYPSQREGGNLLFGSNYYGGMSEIRIYGTSSLDLNQNTEFFNEGHFLMKGLNYENTTGNTLESFKKIVSRYNMKGNWVGASNLSSIPDVTENNSFGNQSLLPKGTNLNNFSNPSFRKLPYRAVQFGVRNLSNLEQINKNKIRLTKSSDKNFLRQSLQPGTNNLTPDSRPEHKKNKDLELERFSSYKISIGETSDKKINEILVDNMSNQDIGQKIGDPRKLNQGNFEDLDKFRDDILSNYTVQTNQTNKFNERISKRVPNSFYSIVERLVPGRITFLAGPVVKNDILFKNKERLGKDGIYSLDAFNKLYTNVKVGKLSESILLHSKKLQVFKNEDTDFVFENINYSLLHKAFMLEPHKAQLELNVNDLSFSNSSMLEIRKAKIDKLSVFESIKSNKLEIYKTGIYNYSDDINLSSNIFNGLGYRLKSNSIDMQIKENFISLFSNIRKTNTMNINYFDKSKHYILIPIKSNIIETSKSVILSTKKSDLYKTQIDTLKSLKLSGSYWIKYFQSLITKIESLSNEIVISSKKTDVFIPNTILFSEELVLSSKLNNLYKSNEIKDVVNRNFIATWRESLVANPLHLFTDKNIVTAMREKLQTDSLSLKEIVDRPFEALLGDKFISNKIDDVVNRRIISKLTKRNYSNAIKALIMKLSSKYLNQLKSNSIDGQAFRKIVAKALENFKSDSIELLKNIKINSTALEKFEINHLDKFDDINIYGKNPWYNIFKNTDAINLGDFINLIESNKVMTNPDINHIEPIDQIELSANVSNLFNVTNVNTIEDDSVSVYWKPSHTPTKEYLGDGMWEEKNIIKFDESLNINPGGYHTKEWNDWKFFDTSVTSTGSFDEDYSGSFGAFVDTMGGFLDYKTSKYISAGFSTRTFSRSIGDTEHWIPIEYTKTPYRYQLGPNPVKSIVQGVELSYHKPNEFDPTDKRQFTDLPKDHKNRKIGRTVQFTEDENGNINYPSNHYKNVCGGLDNLTLHKILFEGTKFTEGDGQTTFDPTNQIDPTKPVTKKKTSSGNNNRLIVE